MNTCSIEEMKTFVFNCGHELTSDLFIIEGNVYWRMLKTEHHVIQHPGNIVVHKTITSDVYFCWCYITKVRRFIDVKTFRTQFQYFSYVKRNHNDYMDKLCDAVMEHNLFDIAIRSEHLY